MKQIESLINKLDKNWADLPLYALTHIKSDLNTANSQLKLIAVCHKYIIILEDSDDEKEIYSICMLILPIFEMLTGKCYELIELE